MSNDELEIVVAVGADAVAAVDEVLRELPEGFGIDEAVRDYVEHARTHRTYLATTGDGTVGVCTLTRHAATSAEIHLLAVARNHHRRGIGRALVTRAEADLSADGVRHLHLKTLGPSDPDEHYARTRRFYAALGFEPLEEHPPGTVWPDHACLVMLRTVR